MITAEVISRIGVEEKYVRKDHYNSLKVWWARRPLRAMRAIIINEILKVRNKESDVIDFDLIESINPNKELLQSFKSKYKSNELTLLDVFGGGGSIPFESARLGLKTISSELNPVASLLQETIFNSIGIKNFGEIFKNEGYAIIERVEERLREFYKVGNIIPYTIFWSKTMKCPKCNSTTNLSRLKYLRKKSSGEIVIPRSTNILDDATDKSFSCDKCNAEITFKEIKTYCISNRLGSSPIALCYYDKTKKYLILNQEDKNLLMSLQDKANNLLLKYQHLIPDEEVDSKYGVINPTLYDLKKHKDFFNNTQLLLLLTVIDEIVKSYPSFLIKYQEPTAKQLLLAATSLIEFLVDWNSTGTMWIPQNEQTGRSLAGPGVSMKWDYIEINPFFKTGSNLKSKVKRVSETFAAINFDNSNISILSGSSTFLDIPDESIDLIVTDPPYFDSIDYTGLSEFFRPWFEVLIRNTYNENISLKNEISQEAIVQLSKNKTGNIKRGGEHYHGLMRDIFIESKRVLKSNGKLVFVYGHKTIEGWEIIARAIKDAGFYIKKIYPLDMERPARPRAMSHQALNGVIVFELVKDKLESLNANELFTDLDEVISNYIPLYLAGLACQFFTNSNKQFNDCYSEIKIEYSTLSISKNESLTLKSNLAEAYLSLLNHQTYLSQDEIQKLINENSLVTENNIPKLLNEIDIAKINVNDPFLRLIDIYKNYTNNSSTKIHLEKDMLEFATYFFSKLSDVDLNTLANRSFIKEKKIFRLIISKLSAA